MRLKLRAALIVGTALAVLATVGLTPTPATARSGDSTSLAQAMPAGRAPTAVDLSAVEWKAAGLVTKARNQAVSNSGKTMDYRKMIKIFGKPARQVDWRRQAAAGFREAGGKITHITKGENKKVEKRRKQLFGKRKPPNASAARVSTDGVVHASGGNGTNCKGQSGRVVINEHESHKYWDSCETIDLQHAWNACVVAMGAVLFLTAKQPKVSIPAFFLGAVCGMVASDIDRNAAKSNVAAIYLRTYREEAYQPYPGGVRYYIRYDLLPQ